MDLLSIMKILFIGFIFILLSSINLMSQAFVPMDYPVWPCDKILVGVTMPTLTGGDKLFLQGKYGLQIGFPGSVKWITAVREHFHEIGWELGYCQRHFTQDISGFNNKFLVFDEYKNIKTVDFATFKDETFSWEKEFGKFNINSIYLTLYYKSYFYGKWYLKPSFLVGVSASTLIFPPGKGVLIVYRHSDSNQTYNDILETDDLGGFLFDGILGLGLDFSFGNCFRVFGLDFRYHYSFNSIAPKYIYKSGDTKIELRDRMFSFNFVLYFGDWFNN